MSEQTTISDGVSRHLHVNGLEAISIRRAARDFGLAPSTLYGWIDKGRLGAYEREGDRRTYVLRVAVARVKAGSQRASQRASSSLQSGRRDAMAM